MMNRKELTMEAMDHVNGGLIKRYMNEDLFTLIFDVCTDDEDEDVVQTFTCTRDTSYSIFKTALLASNYATENGYSAEVVLMG